MSRLDDGIASREAIGSASALALEAALSDLAYRNDRSHLAAERRAGQGGHEEKSNQPGCGDCFRLHCYHIFLEGEAPAAPPSDYSRGSAGASVSFLPMSR